MPEQVLGRRRGSLTLATIGSAALLLVLALALYATGASVVAGLNRDRRLMRSAANAVMGAFAATLLAVLALLVSLVRHDFSIAVVAQHTSRELPTPYLLTALWASQPGSLLLWLTVLTGASSLVMYQNRRRNRELMPWVTAVLGGTMVFFATMAALVSSPFEHVSGAIPADGTGLDPSLQNPYMIAHPPALYLGYVSFAVPFAFAMAALITGRADARWMASVRRWTLFAWASLGVGMLLGAHWAYVEIGWGGYWAWDPVENAALMPWLAGTAYLHSVMVQEKKGMLKVWNVVLVSGTFALSILGTFLTRSGVVNSIHSFVQSPVGPALLGFLALVLAFSTAMLVWRLPLLRSEHRLESLVSREASFLFNNLLLLAFAFAILWGVIFPVLSESVRGIRSTVSVPYYNFFLVAFGLPLLALTGIGPLIAWRRATPGSLWRMFRWPVVSALAGAALLGLLGLGSSPAGLTAFSLCIFVSVTIGLEFARGTAARRAIAGGSWPRALVDLVSRNRRRYGGYVVHLAVVLLVVGIAASGAYGSVNEATLKRGQSMEIGGYTLTYQGLTQSRQANSTETAARLAVSRDGSSLGTLSPGQRSYPIEDRVTNEVDIHTSFTRGDDLYAILQGVSRDSVTIKALVNPMVSLIWLAGIVFLLGAAITIWPDPREARQLARRYATALAKEA
ncbi:MAG: cytochrome c-type biosis protein CcmF [Gaiellales bacterium]|nr:cytochrome c-type biosis protein CcmF [Gaiellales bacterium]